MAQAPQRRFLSSPLVPASTRAHEGLNILFLWEHEPSEAAGMGAGRKAHWSCGMAEPQPLRASVYPPASLQLTPQAQWWLKALQGWAGARPVPAKLPGV